jgi:hypothetical protein
MKIVKAMPEAIANHYRRDWEYLQQQSSPPAHHQHCLHRRPPKGGYSKKTTAKMTTAAFITAKFAPQSSDFRWPLCQCWRQLACYVALLRRIYRRSCRR